ncbi:MAG: hypothetical protein JXL97_00135 [Bacteroidales bacterium]|nr:hypothetical protein [Bacteroidales bacterium]
MVNEVIGWFGAALFAICALPQAIKTFKTKKADDLSWLFLLLWFFGEIFTFAYLIIDDIKINTTHFPLYINYFFNTVIVIYLMYAKKVYKSGAKIKNVAFKKAA